MLCNNMNNKITTYALFAIVPLLLSGIGIQQTFASNADPYSADSVANSLDVVAPYITINDKKIVKLDVKEAKANGVSKEDIKIAKEYMRIQNKMIQNIHDNPKNNMKVDDAQKDKFKQYHEKTRNVGTENDVSNSHYLNFILPTADASHNSCQTSNHPGATHTTTGSYSSRTAAINALASGYNQVPDYATLNEPDDFADWVVAYNCFDGVFRDQTIVYQSGSVWKHSNHDNPSEPNPEVLAYTWPTWNWAWYVEDWHNNN